MVKYGQLLLFKSMQPTNYIQHLHLHFGPCISEVIQAQLLAVCDSQLLHSDNHIENTEVISAPLSLERDETKQYAAAHWLGSYTHMEGYRKKQELIYTKKYVIFSVCCWIGRAYSKHCLRAC